MCVSFTLIESTLEIKVGEGEDLKRRGKRGEGEREERRIKTKRMEKKMTEFSFSTLHASQH